MEKTKTGTEYDLKRNILHGHDIKAKSMAYSKENKARISVLLKIDIPTFRRILSCAFSSSALYLISKIIIQLLKV